MKPCQANLTRTGKRNGPPFMKPSDLSTLSARDRILATANRLFYQQGFQSVGVDTIVAASGVAKMTLYRHFPSKDDLIVAYLEHANEQFWAWLKQAENGIAEPAARIQAIFDALEHLATSPNCLGCSFQNTAAEFPDQQQQAHQVAMAHKTGVRKHFERLAQKAGLQNPVALANQLLMLMDGAWVAARMFGPDNPAVHVGAAARILIEAHTKS